MTLLNRPSVSKSDIFCTDGHWDFPEIRIWCKAVINAVSFCPGYSPETWTIGTKQGRRAFRIRSPSLLWIDGDRFCHRWCLITDQRAAGVFAARAALSWRIMPGASPSTLWATKISQTSSSTPFPSWSKGIWVQKSRRCRYLKRLSLFSFVVTIYTINQYTQTK